MPSSPVPLVEIRRERAGDVDAVADVVAAAFSMAEHSAPPIRPGGPPGEVDLLAWLRADPGWLPGLSVVAVTDKEVVGHAYYPRFGFVLARDLGVEPPEPAWGDHFQARALGGRHHPVGRFAYAEPFNRF